MFGKLMDGIDDDYLRYVFHVQVLTEQAAEPDLARANYVAADDPVQGDGDIAAAFAAASVPSRGRRRDGRPAPPRRRRRAPCGWPTTARRSCPS